MITQVLDGTLETSNYCQITKVFFKLTIFILIVIIKVLIIIVQDEKFNLGPTRSYESIKDCMLTAWYRSYSLLIIIRLPQFDNFLIFLNLIPLLNQFNYHWFHRDYRHCCQHLSQSAFAQERPRVFPRRRNASLLHRWEMD